MAEKPRQQFVNYAFYKLDPAYRRLDDNQRERGKKEFAAVVKEYEKELIIRPYSTVGIRADSDLGLWRISYSLELLQEMQSRLLDTGLGRYLSTPFNFLGLTKRSTYIDKHEHAGSEGSRLTVVPGSAKYLFVYPFVKTREWYALTKPARQGMMNEHIEFGHRYPSVKINTSYSFGLDDQEFVVAFESDSPTDFLDLVMELRETAASRYTLRDTPTFTCIARPVDEALDLMVR
jgi:chlorite dismutase